MFQLSTFVAGSSSVPFNSWLIDPRHGWPSWHRGFVFPGCHVNLIVRLGGYQVNRLIVNSTLSRRYLRAGAERFASRNVTWCGAAAAAVHGSSSCDACSSSRLFACSSVCSSSTHGLQDTRVASVNRLSWLTMYYTHSSPSKCCVQHIYR